MSSWERVERFLTTDPIDAGCAETFALIDLYVEMVAAGSDAEARYPGIAAHLQACQPCAEDFEGLLLAVGGR